MDPEKKRKKQVELKRELTLTQLVVIGVSGALGNGALFGAVGMVTTAGSGAIIAFIFGGVIYISIALTYMELSRVHPEAGAPSRFTLYSHGRTTSLINAFADMVWYIFIPPLEALSIVAGLNYIIPGSPLIIASTGYPTIQGVLVGVGLVLAFTPFNYFGVGMFGKSTLYIGAVKLFFYVSMGLGLIFFVHNFGNFANPDYGGFLPYGISAILLIMPLTMYDFGGIRVIPDLAGETKLSEVEKKDAIVKAVAYTVLFETLIYISIAVAILASINWSALGIAPGDFSSLKGAMGGNNPFFILANSNNLGIIFAFAVVAGIMAPFVTGYIYTGAGARIFFSSARSGFLGGAFKELHARYAVPFWALITFAIVGAITVMISAPAPTVYSVIVDATVAGYLGFSTHPVAMIVQRRQGITTKAQKFRGAYIFGPIAMGVSSLVVYWSGWPSDPYAMLLILFGILIFGIPMRAFEQIRNSLWYMFYFVFLLLIVVFSHTVGPEQLFGIQVGYIPFVWGTLIVFLTTTLVFFPWGVLSGLKEEYYHEEYTAPYRAPVKRDQE
ncbi:MAG TPA: APC family permease [Thermoplasmataceae archaeon]|nr:APC family permease [Thermoplasmataceae archaeon]